MCLEFPSNGYTIAWKRYFYSFIKRKLVDYHSFQVSNGYSMELACHLGSFISVGFLKNMIFFLSGSEAFKVNDRIYLKTSWKRLLVLASANLNEDLVISCKAQDAWRSFYLSEKHPSSKIMQQLSSLNIPPVKNEWLIQCLIAQRILFLDQEFIWAQ